MSKHVAVCSVTMTIYKLTMKIMHKRKNKHNTKGHITVAIHRPLKRRGRALKFDLLKDQKRSDPGDHQKYPPLWVTKRDRTA